MKPNILVTIPKGEIFDSFFDVSLIDELNGLGNVRWNNTTEHYDEEQVNKEIRDIDILMTGWGCININDNILNSADKLKLIVHNGGTVRPMIDEKVYNRGIKVCSGNKIFAKSVSEGVLTYILLGLRKVPNYLNDVKDSKWPRLNGTKGLFNKKIGLVGFGEITMNLIKFLHVFDCEIFICSNYVSKNDEIKYGIKLVTQDYIFENCDIVSLHQSLRKDNFHSIGKEQLSKLKKGALFINTARGELIVENELINVLSKRKDLTAILDVYEQEPLPLNSKLRELDNVFNMPHAAGPTEDMRKETTKSMIDEIKRFMSNIELEHEVVENRISYMTTVIK